MECEQVKQLLTEFLEGELPAGTVGEVRRHLMDCASCRKKLLRKQQIFSRLKLSSPISSSEDWLDRVEKKIPPAGWWPEMIKGLLLPWEKKIPILAGFLTLLFVIPLVFHQIGCDQKKTGKTAAVSLPTPGQKQPPVKLRKSSHGSVLILDEGGAKGKKTAGGEINHPNQKMPNYRPFQDQQVKVFVSDVEGALPRAVKIALGAGGQVIKYPIKGFENMGPNEKTLVFDMRTYRPFLKKLQVLGRVEHPPIVRSDYVTVRMTLLPETGSSSK